MSIIPYRRILTLTWLLACAGCTTVERNGGIVYEVDIDGAGWSLARTLRESTATCKLIRQHPSTTGQLRHRMEQDQEPIEAILQSQGYYDGSVRLYLNEERKPVQVEIKVYRGRRYEFRRVRLRFMGKPDEALDRIRSRVSRGQDAIASAVFDDEQRILDTIKRNGYPFPRLVRRKVEVDHDAQAVDLEMVFDPGEPARFGTVRVEGLETLPGKYIKRQVPWREGDKYNAKELDDFERKLLASGLFSSVRVGLQETEVKTNAIPVVIRVGERAKRTVRLGVNYTDIGPGAKGYWENRSLFGGGERLETSIAWNPVKISGTGRFTRTGFLAPKQSLVLDLEATHDNPDAYDARRTSGQGMLLRDFTSRLQGGFGVGYKYSRVEQLDMDEHYSHVYFPLQPDFDSRNDRLDPVRGMQMFGHTALFNDMLGSESFLKTQVEGRHYATFSERYRLSSALRITLGSIDGVGIGAVPADERFYAGGGGSIRGYEYQQVGPQLGGIPSGGDRLVEFSAEMRLRPGKRLGYVAFVDGGTVYNEELSGFDRSLHYGAGLGVRWFTGIGPLRVDFAYPLNPPSNQVERIQFYISLGQAF